MWNKEKKKTSPPSREHLTGSEAPSEARSYSYMSLNKYSGYYAWQRLFPRLNSGDISMCPSLGVQRERQQYCGLKQHLLFHTVSVSQEQLSEVIFTQCLLCGCSQNVGLGSNQPKARLRLKDLLLGWLTDKSLARHLSSWFHGPFQNFLARLQITAATLFPSKASLEEYARAWTQESKSCSWGKSLAGSVMS